MDATIDVDRYDVRMTAHAVSLEPTGSTGPLLADEVAATYAEWFGTISDPTRLKLLHAVASSAAGALTVGDLAQRLGISQSTCSHHVRRLSEVGFLIVDRVGRTSMVSVNQSCCTGLPHAADVVMGTTETRPCCPTDWPAEVSTRAMDDGDLHVVRDIYAEGIATRNATFETEVPTVGQLRTRWLPEHRWVAELEGRVVGWTATSAVSSRECYAGVGETSVYVAEKVRGRGVGKALMYRQVTEADAGGLWTLQTSVFPENRASIALHHSAGYRTLAVRSRIARLDGVWRDTVLLERRRDDEDAAQADCAAC
jgi:L-amino acid N-acyltransferase YncA/DNA-binding transcriptional ArsR family regulator